MLITLSGPGGNLQLATSQLQFSLSILWGLQEPFGAAEHPLEDTRKCFDRLRMLLDLRDYAHSFTHCQEAF